MSTKCRIFNQIKIRIRGMKIFKKTKILKSLSSLLHGQEEGIKMINLIQKLIINNYLKKKI
jgi:hypothetical protein